MHNLEAWHWSDPPVTSFQVIPHVNFTYTESPSIFSNSRDALKKKSEAKSSKYSVVQPRATVRLPLPSIRSPQLPLPTADCLGALTWADVHMASAYFLLLLIYHFRTWTLGRQNLSLHWAATGSPLKHKCGWAPGGAECSPYAPGLSPGPALLLCLVLVMDELWGMMNRLLSGPEHILIWDSDAKRAEHRQSALYSRIQAILYILCLVVWLIRRASISKNGHRVMMLSI